MSEAEPIIETSESVSTSDLPPPAAPSEPERNNDAAEEKLHVRVQEAEEARDTALKRAKDLEEERDQAIIHAHDSKDAQEKAQTRIQELEGTLKSI